MENKVTQQQVKELEMAILFSAAKREKESRRVFMDYLNLLIEGWESCKIEFDPSLRENVMIITYSDGRVEWYDSEGGLIV